MCHVCALQADTTGLGIVVLTALTERQWVEEDEFARSLNLPPKMVRKAMRFLEEVSCGWAGAVQPAVAVCSRELQKPCAAMPCSTAVQGWLFSGASRICKV